MYAVTDEVPIPTHGPSGQYPFRHLEVGESFLVLDRPVSAVQRSASAANRRLKPLRFATRREQDGVRVWRVE